MVKANPNSQRRAVSKVTESQNERLDANSRSNPSRMALSLSLSMAYSEDDPPDNSGTNTALDMAEKNDRKQRFRDTTVKKIN